MCKKNKRIISKSYKQHIWLKICRKTMHRTLNLKKIMFAHFELQKKGNRLVTYEPENKYWMIVIFHCLFEDEQTSSSIECFSQTCSHQSNKTKICIQNEQRHGFSIEIQIKHPTLIQIACWLNTYKQNCKLHHTKTQSYSTRWLSFALQATNADFNMFPELSSGSTDSL